MGSDVGQSPELVRKYTACVKQSVKIPVIPKMTPNITHIAEPATACVEAGADAISAINTIKSVTMTFDAEVSGQRTVSGYSGRAVRPIALRYILELAQMRNNSQFSILNPQFELSGIGGIETWRDALEFIQLGCSNVQVCTAVMQYGYRIIDDLILGLQRYMAKRGVSELQQLVGERVEKFLHPDSLDRNTIIYPKFDKDLCIGCGRCEISCSDGGHQAIVFETIEAPIPEQSSPTRSLSGAVGGAKGLRRPRLIGTKCVGCHLCRLVCPTGAIGVTKRIEKKKTTV
jgi:dihydropyrimidine dehydrogenase (NAD+) subunit PreA